MGVPDSCSYDCGGVFDPFVRDCGDLMQRLVDQPISSQMYNFKDRCAQLDPVSIAVALDDAFCDICGDSVLSRGRHVSHSLHDMYCGSYDDDISFSELPAAQVACTADPTCQFVYDGACDGQPYRVCRGPETVSSGSGSCLISQMIDEECDDGAPLPCASLLDNATSLTTNVPVQESSTPRSQTPTAAQTAAWQDAAMASLTAMRTATMEQPTRTPQTRPAALTVRPRAVGMPLSTPTQCVMQVTRPTKQTTSYFPFVSVRSITGQPNNQQ